MGIHGLFGCLGPVRRFSGRIDIGRFDIGQGAFGQALGVEHFGRFIQSRGFAFANRARRRSLIARVVASGEKRGEKQARQNGG